MLEQELTYYEEIKEELLNNHQGKFVLIHRRELLGVYDTDEEAYAQGVRRFGTGPFLIQPVADEDPEDKYPALVLGLMNADS